MRATILTEADHDEIKGAICDILYLYEDCAWGYSGRGIYAADEARFDPFKFVKCEWRPTGNYGPPADFTLLQEGSAFVLLEPLQYYLYNLQGPPSDLRESTHPSFTRPIQFLQAGGLDHLPLAKATLAAAYRDEGEFFELEAQMISTYIGGYYRKRGSEPGLLPECGVEIT